jgi:hypothetical protein
MPGRRSAMAAKPRQPAISTDPQWATETAGSKPAVSMSLRRTSAGRSSPAGASSLARILRHRSGTGQRGPAPSRGPRIFPVRTSRLLRVVCTLPSQSMPEILQPILPSGFASRDRTRTTVAATSAARSKARPCRPLPRSLSSLVGIFHGHADAYASFAPQKEEGAGRFRDRSGPLAPFLQSRTPETGR